MEKKIQHLTNSLTYMIRSRAIDLIEQEYTARGEAFFHVSGRGHEGINVLYSFLTEEDWVHAHYRDKSLLLARGVTPYDYFLALFNKAGSHSKGRQMNAHMSSPQHKIFSLVGPVGNSQLQAAGVAATLKGKENQPIVISNIGDGATAQGEFLEGLTLSIRDSLPVLTIIEDNNFAISTYTKGTTFFQIGDKQIDEYLGCPITRINGRDPFTAYDTLQKIIASIRENCEPQIVIFEVERLDSHTNADDHKVYRTNEDINTIREEGDPIIRLMMSLYNEDHTAAKIRLATELEKEIASLREQVTQAQNSKEPEPTFTAKRALPSIIKEKHNETYEEGDNTMILAIRNVLDEWLKKDSRVFLYGEDIEDPKGDVFGLTKGLSTAYPSRVVNSPLSESLIVGSSVGRALAGQIPVAFLQFADFLPLITNQLYSELGTMHWRSNGGWKVPVIVMATSGGYKPGLGPFHAASMESAVAHIPGIDVYSPSNAADAAGLLNTAFMSGRPSVFFYPKNLLNTKTFNISEQSARSHVLQPGVAKIVEEGTDITIVGYGNTIPLSQKVSKALAEVGKATEIIDLRTISPLDHKTIIQSVQKTGKLLVTHEENGTAGIGAEVVARVTEALPQVIVQRVTRRDTFVPCNFSNHVAVLPSYKTILDTAVDMLGGTIEWKKDTTQQDGIVTIEAVGSSPSDETLTIIEWKVAAGDQIQAGELIADGEANKAEAEIKALVSGTVKELLVVEGDTVDIGAPIAYIQTSENIIRTVTREESGTPIIAWNPEVVTTSNNDTKIYLGYESTVLGNKLVTNADIVTMSPKWDEESIEASTGIKERHWIGEDQTLVSMTADAARKSLKKAKIKITDITGIVCATGTHKYLTPSLAAMVQHELLQDIEDEATRKSYVGYAYDVSAACSGFMYALSSAYHHLKVNANEKILMLTGEVLSERTDMDDYQTAPVFSDAASAFIVSSSPEGDAAEVALPILQTKGEPAKHLVVPGIGSISMDGVEVYKIAVEQLKYIAETVCRTNNINIDDIDLIVPHQANIKIIKGVARRMKISLDKFFTNIDTHGNSSSNTIPICLDELAAQDQLKGKTILTIAFGGGYTFGGTILRY